MTAGEQVAFEPALALCSLRSPSRARRARGDRRSGAISAVPGAVGDLEDVARAGSRRSRPDRRRGSCAAGVARDDVAQELARGRAWPRPWSRPGCDRHGIVAEVGQARSRSSSAAVGVRVRAHAARRLSGPVRRSRARAGPSRRRALRAGSSASSPRACARCSGFSRSPPAAPGARARCLRPACRRPPSGRSSPWACAARSSASAAARSIAVRARRCWIARSVEHVVERRGHVLVHRRRVVAVDEVAAR